MQPITPIFLVSLPRSGSTLLQRLLAAHDAIATTTEPWLLLPLIQARQTRGCVAHYSQWRSVIAHEDFAKALPNGPDDDRAELAAYVQRLYRQAAGTGPSHFLDKTPRYSLILPQLLDIFPHAKFVVLWRNPMAVAASMMTTWAAGKWNLDDYRVDFYDGVPRMVEAVQQHSDRVHALSYEQLITQPADTLRDLLRYLELPSDATLLERFQDVRLAGRFGDQTGIKAYDTLSDEPLDKWRETMCNSFRRSWCRRYLHWLGRERLATMGYDLAELLDALHHTPRKGTHLVSDLLRHSYGILNAHLELDLLRAKRRHQSEAHPAISHS